MVKKLLRSLREYRRDSLLAPMMVIFEVLVEVTVPLLMALIIDKGIEASNMPYIWRMGIILAVLTLCSLTFGALSGRYAARASAGFAKNLRDDMFTNIQSYSFANMDKFSTASLITRLTTDVTNVQNAFQMVIRILVRSPAMFTFALIMAFNVNARLALTFLAIAPFLIIGLYLIIMKAHPIFTHIFKRYDVLNTVVQENVRGVRVVKSFVREEKEKQKFADSSADIFRHFVKAEKLLALNGPLMQTCIYTCILVISWLGAKMIVVDSMTTGELMSMFAYIMQILFSLMMLSMVFVMMIISKASAERITEVLDEQSSLQNPAQPVKSVVDGSISFDKVSFSYSGDKEKLALHQLTLDIPSGSTIGIIGGTGSGKTTLVQLIPRLYDVTEGLIKIGGIPVGDYDLDILRKEIAVVLQKNVLFSGTIKDNLRWGNPDASDEELVQACKLAQADDFIRSFPEGYDTMIDQDATNVSGGQKQRLCIARAILKKPKVLIFDDSTSAVDTRTDMLIRKALREEIPATTKIIIAQRVASIMDADTIVVMDGGKMTDMGTHEELLSSSEIYREVYYSQVRESAVVEQ